MGKGHRRVAHDEHFTERLAEPWLIDRAVFLNVEVHEQAIAVQQSQRQEQHPRRLVRGSLPPKNPRRSFPSYIRVMLVPSISAAVPVPLDSRRRGPRCYRKWR